MCFSIFQLAWFLCKSDTLYFVSTYLLKQVTYSYPILLPTLYDLNVVTDYLIKIVLNVKVTLFVNKLQNTESIWLQL